MMSMLMCSQVYPKVFFKTPYGDVRLHELSLGYKTLIAWMVDFANGLFDEYPESKDPLAEPAVCLVDEIDLHLHPKFQRTIIQVFDRNISQYPIYRYRTQSTNCSGRRRTAIRC